MAWVLKEIYKGIKLLYLHTVIIKFLGEVSLRNQSVYEKINEGAAVEPMQREYTYK